MSKKGALIGQKLIFDEATQSLDLNARAYIDLVTFYGDHQMTRVPRFMIWRDLIKLKWDAKNKTLNAYATSASRLIVPKDVFTVTQIQKIELSKHSLAYPGTELKLRTNPAASRGEKLFTQSCLACHSLPQHKNVTPAQLTESNLKSFPYSHQSLGITLDSKNLRGLIAYSEALASQKNEVQSKK